MIKSHCINFEYNIQSNDWNKKIYMKYENILAIIFEYFSTHKIEVNYGKSTPRTKATCFNSCSKYETRNNNVKKNI